MQYGGGAGTGRTGSLLTPLLPRIAVGATHSSTLWHGSRAQAMLCRVCETHQGRRQYSLKQLDDLIVLGLFVESLKTQCSVK